VLILRLKPKKKTAEKKLKAFQEQSKKLEGEIQQIKKKMQKLQTPNKYALEQKWATTLDEDGNLQMKENFGRLSRRLESQKTLKDDKEYKNITLSGAKYLPHETQVVQSPLERTSLKMRGEKVQPIIFTSLKFRGPPPSFIGINVADPKMVACD